MCVSYKPITYSHFLVNDYMNIIYLLSLRICFLKGKKCMSSYRK